MVEYFGQRNGACMKKKLSLKKFLSRRLAGGVLLLSNLSLVSIGFSAWSISAVTTGEAEINVSAADLIDLNQYFLFVDSPTIFEYTSDGLVKDHVIRSATLDGYIEIPFRIDVKGGKIREHLSSDSTGFNLGTILVDRNQNLDLFSVCSATEVKLAVSAAPNSFSDTDYTIASQSNVATNKELSSGFDLSAFPYLDKSLVYFSVRYKVNFNVTDFKKDVYNKLSNGSFRFSFKAGGIFDNE